MVREIDKIAYNVLAAGKELFLPGIGSLFTERFGAKRVSRTGIEQPRKIIAFTDQRRGVSLEEEIGRVAEVDAERAHELFDEWLMKALDGDTLTIEGVGCLHHENFVMTDEFAETINRQGRNRVKIKPRSNTALYAFAALCCIFALGVAGYVVFENKGDGDKPKDTSIAATDTAIRRNAETQATATAADPKPADAASAGTAAAASSATQMHETPTDDNAAKTAKTSAPENDDTTVFDTTPGRNYVVYGIFSTPENAFRAAAEAAKRADGVRGTVYRYGARYMVSLHDSDDRNECLGYMDSRARDFRDLWIYTKK